eukprot:12932819-Prorocentrum_lima.AAC.1
MHHSHWSKVSQGKVPHASLGRSLGRRDRLRQALEVSCLSALSTTSPLAGSVKALRRVRLRRCGLGPLVDC